MKNHQKMTLTNTPQSKIMLVLMVFITLFFIVLVGAVPFPNSQAVEYFNWSLTSTTGIGSGNWRCQTFLIGGNGTNIDAILTGVALRVFRTAGQPHQNTSIILYSTDASLAPLAPLVYNRSFDTANIPEALSWINISMPPYIMKKDTRYAICINSSVAGTDSIRWAVTAAGTFYRYGNISNSADSGTSWTFADGNTQAGFEIWGIQVGFDVTLTSPIDSLNTSNRTINFNCTGTSMTGEIVNTTLFINNITNYTTIGTNNVTELYYFLTLPKGNYNWTCGTNNGTVTQNGTMRTFTIVDWKENTQTFNATSYETAYENFLLNITYDASSYTSVAVTLYYNGTEYSTTKTGSGNEAIFNRGFDINTITSTTQKQEIYWTVGLTNSSGTFYSNSTFYNQTVNKLWFISCNTTHPMPYINYTFKDETTLTAINATIAASTFEYYLGLGTVTKTLSYSNSTAHYSYGFCSSKNDSTLRINPYIQYASSGYPQRIYDITVQSFTNITTNKTLYLLSSTDGVYVTFQVVNSAEQVLEGVSVNITRNIEGVNTILGSGTTGAAGTITFWLNPDYAHTATFFLAPYPLFSVTQAFSDEPPTYTIVLGSSASTNATDYTRGISYSISPISSYLSNGTSYSFNFTINSTYWALDSFGFNITNASGFVLGTASSTSSSGGKVNIILNTGSNTTILMKYYWIINGTVSSATRSWLVIDLGDSGFSISNLVTNFKTYVGLGFFGLGDFGLGIICFIIIIAITGTLKLKYGIADESVLVGVVFALVALLDVGLNLIPNFIDAVPHFPTIFMGIVFAGFIFKEVFQ